MNKAFSVMSGKVGLKPCLKEMHQLFVFDSRDNNHLPETEGIYSSNHKV